ncbi:MAG TPA: GNAT family N-acetyltransferase [Rhabdochlamydiaceae bacterium]|nr:GNAT family N-acetyltransferase [Rhabdochlamydiaceae bacterium]
MSDKVGSVSSATHTYYGNAEITFSSNDDEGLFVEIKTAKLRMRSTQANDAECDRYASLFGSKRVMEKFATGETKTREEMQTRIKDVWAKRWHDKDPYSGLAVFKKDTDEFVGHVALGHSATEDGKPIPGQAEVGYLFLWGHWGQGFGTEAAQALINEYAPATVKEGYLLDGKPLQRVVATARVDNEASWHIAEGVGMNRMETKEKYGALRYHYSIELKDIIKKQKERLVCDCAFL